MDHFLASINFLTSPLVGEVVGGGEKSNPSSFCFRSTRALIKASESLCGRVSGTVLPWRLGTRVLFRTNSCKAVIVLKNKDVCAVGGLRMLLREPLMHLVLLLNTGVLRSTDLSSCTRLHRQLGEGSRRCRPYLPGDSGVRAAGSL